jgi:hypothetical protein
MFGQLLINKNKITIVFNSDSGIPIQASKHGLYLLCISLKSRSFYKTFDRAGQAALSIEVGFLPMQSDWM